MRLRPNLCRSGDASEGTTALTDAAMLSGRVAAGAIEHTSSLPPKWGVYDRPRCRYRALSARRPRRATPRRMSCSDTLMPSRPNGASTSSRIATPATIVGARSGCRPGTSRRSASGIAASRADRLQARARERVALDARAGRRARARGRSPRTRSPCRRRRRPPGRARARRPGPPASKRRAHVARRAPRARRRAGGSPCRWRSVWRTTPTWVETWKRDARRPRPTTNSVEPPPMSTTSSSRPSGGRAAAVAPRKVSRASSSPRQRARRRGRSGRARAAANSRAVARVAHGAGQHGGRGPAAPWRVDRRGVVARAPRRRARCGLARRARRSRRRPAPSRVTVDARSSSATAPSVDVGDQQPRRVRPDVDDARARARDLCCGDRGPLLGSRGAAAGPRRLLGLELPRLARAVYPSGLPPAPLARRTTRRCFGTVEVNATFYRLQRPEAVARWVEQTPPGFVFAVKASRYLTHMKRLTDIGHGVAPLLRRDRAARRVAASSARSCGSSPSGCQRDDERLAAALDALPPGRHAVEFRHPSWFASGLRAAARARRRARRSATTRRALAGPRDDRRLDLRALPPRPPRPPRQLLRDRAARRGRSGSPAGAGTSRCSPTSTTTGRASRSETRSPEGAPGG